MRTIILLAALLCACPPGPVSPPPDADAAPFPPPVLEAGADVCARACAVMRAAGCPSGGLLVDGGDACERVCQHAREPGGFDMKPDCIASKTDRAGVLSCGTVRCR